MHIYAVLALPRQPVPSNVCKSLQTFAAVCCRLSSPRWQLPSIQPAVVDNSSRLLGNRMFAYLRSSRPSRSAGPLKRLQKSANVCKRLLQSIQPVVVDGNTHPLGSRIFTYLNSSRPSRSAGPLKRLPISANACKRLQTFAAVYPARGGRRQFSPW